MFINNQLPVNILLKSYAEVIKKREEEKLLKEPVPKDVFDFIIERDNKKYAESLEMDENGNYELVFDEHGIIEEQLIMGNK